MTYFLGDMKYFQGNMSECLSNTAITVVSAPLKIWFHELQCITNVALLYIINTLQHLGCCALEKVPSSAQTGIAVNFVWVRLCFINIWFDTIHMVASTATSWSHSCISINQYKHFLFSNCNSVPGIHRLLFIIK